MEVFHSCVLGSNTSCGAGQVKKDVNESISSSAVHINRLCSSCLLCCNSDLTTFISRRSLQGL